MKKIMYIGRHPEFTDNMYGTGLTWVKRETVHGLQDAIGKKFLRHTDSFEDVEREPNADSTILKAPLEQDDELSVIRDSIVRMDINALADFAYTNFSGYTLDKGLDLVGARAQVESMVDRFGVAGVDEDEEQRTGTGMPLVDEPIEDLHEDVLQVKPVADDITAAVTSEPEDSQDDDPPSDPPPPMSFEEQIFSMTKEGLKPSEIGQKLGVAHQKITAVLRAR